MAVVEPNWYRRPLGSGAWTFPRLVNERST
jgi:hypothetical protein